MMTFSDFMFIFCLGAVCGLCFGLAMGLHMGQSAIKAMRGRISR